MIIDFTKNNGLVPAIVQDAETKNILMLGYMNEEAYVETLKSKRITFYSRNKQCLWTKGETSNNFLELKDIKVDCDNDTLLVKVKQTGPTCHTGTDTCWAEENNMSYGYLSTLENIIKSRKENPSPDSYVASLLAKGINKVAQKVGEEAIELVIEAKDNNEMRFLNESADLLFHFLILLHAKGFDLNDAVKVLRSRRA